MALTKADQTAIATMIATALASVQGGDDPAPARGTNRRKSTKGNASDIGRESTFPLANLVAYQGVSDDLSKGDTFTYNRAKGKGSSEWKVTKVSAGIVHATKVA